MRVHAYAAPAVSEPLAPAVIERRDVGPHDVLIEVKYAGICHSDIHTVLGDWGPQPYPLVPGHEIVGIVAEAGSQVTRHHVGDQVGVGCMVDSCRECTNCRNGQEQYCLKGMTPTYGGVDRDGTVTRALLHPRSRRRRLRAQHPRGHRPRCRRSAAVRRHHRLLPAAALRCRAGQARRGCGPRRSRPHGGQARSCDGRRCHGAVPVAEEAGARSPARRRPLLRDQRPRHIRGAHGPVRPHRQYRQRPHRRRRLPRPARRRRALVNVGAPAEPLSLNVFPLLNNRRSYAGSMISGIRETKEMLDFCAEHRLGADIELISADQINDAYERVLASDVRYRFVIDTATLADAQPGKP